VSEERRQRLAELLKRQQRRNVLPDIIAWWAKYGISVSPVSDKRHNLLTQMLEGGLSWPLDYSEDYISDVRTFVAQNDIVAICGWDIAEEPAVLVSAADLLRQAGNLTSLYLDGFFIADPSFQSGLGVDWDEDDQNAYTAEFKIGRDAPNQ
jgi:hypothetical protein